MAFNSVFFGGGNDTFPGTAADDQVFGGGGNDLLNGADGYDALNGQAGNDTLMGGNGGDFLVGGPGDDLVDGGAGYDRAGYFNGATGPVTVDLNLQGTPQNTGGGVDTLLNIENVSGTPFNDVLTGDGGDNWIAGQGGDDTLSGGGGNDLVQVSGGNSVMDGGAGVDTATFIDNGDPSLLNFSMSLAAQGAPQATGHGSVTLTNFENLSGASGNDTLTGDEGANLLAGGEGGDSLIGGGGDDTLLGDGFVGVDSGGAGTSGPITVFEVISDLGGIAGNDTLAGGGGADLLVGGGGDDVLDGGTGDDTLEGQDGDDLLTGGAGNDVFVIGGGHDSITDFTVGQDRYDLSIYGFDSFAHLLPYLTDVGGSTVFSITFEGGQVTQTFQGVPLASLTGNEFIFAPASSPHDFEGSDSADFIPGGAGNDTSSGFGGNDTLTAFGGDDSLNGGSGDDILDGGAGADTMVGGPGDDAYVVDNAGDVVTEFPGEGTDTIQTTLASFNLGALGNVENLVFTGSGTFVGRGNGANNLVVGGTGNDDVRGGGGDDTVQGGGGSDLIYGNFGDDVIDGGAGFDRAGFFTGATGGVTVDLNLQGTPQNTGQGVDTLLNIENVSSTPFNDVLTGDGGDNWLWSQGGDDTVSGGGGNDLIQPAAGNSVLDGGAGVDTASFNNNGDNTLLNVTLSLAAQGAPQATGHGSVTLTNFENLSGGDGSDTLTGDVNANLLAGGLGNDSLSGGGGNDTLLGDGMVTIDGTGSGAITTFTDMAATFAEPGGNDTLDGGTGADTMTGGLGDDTYVVDDAGDKVVELAGQGVDTIQTTLAFFNLGAVGNVENLVFTGSGTFAGRGDGGNNLVAGADGNDDLRGNGGNDTLQGGGGGDLLYGNFGNDVIDGGAGYDRAGYFSGATGPVTVDLTLQGVGQNTGQGIDTLISIENVSGTAFNDVLTGDGGDNWLAGQGGDDTLSGGGGADLVQISSGNSVMDGGAGVDTATFTDNGDPSLLNVSLSLAAQGVSQATGHGSVTLTNFENLSGASGSDTLTGDAAANLLAGADGGDSLIGGGGDDTLLGDGYVGVDTGGAGTSGPITVFDDVSALGGIGGNDTLDGGTGADTMVGGLGDDTYVVDSAGDVVTELGGQGVDTIQTTLSFFDLGALGNVENLTFTGSGSFIGLGNAANNNMAGGNSDDLLRGSGGDDTLSGGGGGDYLQGGLGNDLIDGGAGFDRAVFFTGATGPVTVDLNLQGSAQNTGQGLDTLLNIENVSGTAFNDVLTGDGGGNWLWGVTGADTINGGGGDDLIQTLGGDSVLDGGAGNSDTASFNNNGDNTLLNVTVSLAAQGSAQATGHGSMTLTNFENLSGGDGSDTLGGDSGANLLAGGLGGDSLAGGAGADTLLGDGMVIPDTGSQGYSGPIITNTDVAVTFAQPGGNDTLDGGTGADTMTGGLGDDTYVVDDAGDHVVELAGQGVDTIQTTLSSFSLATTANVENLTFTGAGNFTGTGDAGANVITGGAGNDSLTGGTGADTMVGGAGSDTYVVDNVGDVVSEQSGQGTDTIRTALTTYSLGATPDIESLVFTGGGAAFTGTGNAADNTISGGGGSDLIDGGDGNDVINGGGGANTLLGGAGDDTISHGNGADLIDGGDGNDVLNDSPNAGSDTFNGGAGDDTFLVRNFIGVPEGTFGGSQFNGGSGTDYLVIGSHVNFQGTFSSIEGISFFAAGGSFSAGILEIGASQMDSLSPTANFKGAGQVHVSLDSEHVFDGSGYTFDPASSVAFALDGAAGSDTITGTSNGDVIHGNDSDDPSTGGDSLSGGGGSDTLEGSDGNDTLNGGAGADVFGVSAGQDVIVGFVHGEDRFDLSHYGFDSFTSLQPYLSDVGGSAVLSFTYNGAQVTHTFQGVPMASLDAGDFMVAGATTPGVPGTDNADLLPGSSSADILSGAGGNDTLMGFGGDDSLDGGAGDDVLNGGAGVDILAGGAGNDTYVVDNAGDAVNETSGNGTDAVRTTLAAYSLTPEVETLTFTGSGNFAGTGNGLANALTGGAGNDTLDGGAGADTLTGAAGDDTYVVDSVGDVVTELLGAGTDTVQTTLASYNLASAPNVENLTYIGGGNFSGVGGGGSNVITGGGGSDTLDGGNGNDTLVGGAGDDTFIVDASGDVVTEAAGGGSSDTIQTSLTAYSLAALSNVENLFYTGTKNFGGTGNGAANIVSSGGGNDTLDGGGGADSLTGGAGNDTYVVDNAGDVVNEAASGGADTIQTTLLSFSLASQPNIENLTYTGAGNFSGVGNASANALTGGAGNDTLDGGAGADSLTGGAGNDTYVVGAGDSVTEGNSGGVDTVLTALTTFSLASLSNVENVTFNGVGSFTGTGDSGDNVLTGGGSGDVLDGGKGNDTMVGGGGDDVYLVDSLQDSVVEQADGGASDTVRTGLAGLTLAANVETLIYTGTKAFSGVGNAGSNSLTSAGGNDTLDGGAGADNLTGGAGNDTYVVDDAGDVVNEALGAGTDTIQTTLNTSSLASVANVENLTFAGSGNFAGTGNGLGNVITGGAGGDTLGGGLGNDTLTGGAGADRFVFDTAPNAATNLDRITDFTPGSDRIALDHTIFTLGGAASWDPTMLRAGNGVTTAFDNNDFLIYNSKTGALYYDADANGAGGAIQIAVLTGSPTTLMGSDFILI